MLPTPPGLLPPITGIIWRVSPLDIMDVSTVDLGNTAVDSGFGGTGVREKS